MHPPTCASSACSTRASSRPSGIMVLGGSLACGEMWTGQQRSKLVGLKAERPKALGQQRVRCSSACGTGRGCRAVLPLGGSLACAVRGRAQQQIVLRSFQLGGDTRPLGPGSVSRHPTFTLVPTAQCDMWCRSWQAARKPRPHRPPRTHLQQAEQVATVCGAAPQPRRPGRLVPGRGAQQQRCEGCAKGNDLVGTQRTHSWMQQAHEGPATEFAVARAHSPCA